MVGIVAAACGLAVAELMAGIWTSLSSPVLSVGDRVVDNVPRPLKEWAISTFGTSDKAVLVGGVLILLALFAVGVGVVALRRGVRAGLVGVAVFSLLGVLAALGRGGTGWSGIVPSLVAGVVAAAVLVLLVHQAGHDVAAAGLGFVDPPPSGTGGDGRGAVPMTAATRRQFLGTAAALSAGAVVMVGAGRWLRQRGVATTERLRVMLPSASRPLPPVPAAADLGVPGAVPFITPNADFFRIDTALTLPQVDPRDWTLTVKGRVDRELTLTYEQLLERPMVESDITLSCVSNEVGGDLVGNARWLGCRLDDLLTEAGIDPSADQIVGRSVDGFTAGFPTALLDGRDAARRSGHERRTAPDPPRVPGPPRRARRLRLRLGDQVVERDRTDPLRRVRGVLDPARLVGRRADQDPVTHRHSGPGSDGGRRTTHPIAGVAWAPVRGIERVEVQIDDGDWRGRGARRGVFRHDLASVEAVLGADARDSTRSGCGRPTATA